MTLRAVRALLALARPRTIFALYGTQKTRTIVDFVVTVVILTWPTPPDGSGSSMRAIFVVKLRNYLNSKTGLTDSGAISRARQVPCRKPRKPRKPPTPLSAVHALPSGQRSLHAGPSSPSRPADSHLRSTAETLHCQAPSRPSSPGPIRPWIPRASWPA